MIESRFAPSPEPEAGQQNQERLTVHDLGDIPAFFIPFPPNFDISARVELYNLLLKEGFPVFYRSFGFNGFFNGKNISSLKQFLKERNLQIYYGGANNDSFIIKGQIAGKSPIFDVGCQATVAAYKLATFSEYSGCFCTIDPNDSFSIQVIDHKGTNLLVAPIEEINLPSSKLPSPQEIGLFPIGGCNEVTMSGKKILHQSY